MQQTPTPSAFSLEDLPNYSAAPEDLLAAAQATVSAMLDTAAQARRMATDTPEGSPALEALARAFSFAGDALARLLEESSADPYRVAFVGGELLEALEDDAAEAAGPDAADVRAAAVFNSPEDLAGAVWGGRTERASVFAAYLSARYVWRVAPHVPAGLPAQVFGAYMAALSGLPVNMPAVLDPSRPQRIPEDFGDFLDRLEEGPRLTLPPLPEWTGEGEDDPAEDALDLYLRGLPAPSLARSGLRAAALAAISLSHMAAPGNEAQAAVCVAYREAAAVFRGLLDRADAEGTPGASLLALFMAREWASGAASEYRATFDRTDAAGRAGAEATDAPGVWAAVSVGADPEDVATGAAYHALTLSVIMAGRFPAEYIRRPLEDLLEGLEADARPRSADA